MAQSDIKFATGAHESAVIRKIAYRAISLAREHRSRLDLIGITMDISATHANGCPLRLDSLLEAGDFDFMHDVYGINRHLDRQTGRLSDLFRPRFAVPAEPVVA